MKRFNAVLQQKIIDEYCERRSDGSYRYRVREIARANRISPDTIHRLTRKITMKRLEHLSTMAQKQIINQYCERIADGTYRYALYEIARDNEVSRSMINNIVRQARLPLRTQRRRKLKIPSARVLKILRDATEPGVTLEEAGRRNPRVIFAGGKQVLVPLTKQRIKQLVDFWEPKGYPGRHSLRFNPGDEIEWGGNHYTVVKYINNRKGVVTDHADDQKINPFMWYHRGEYARLVKAAPVKK
jgi:predicted DNA-binding protein YlxM (UPF0122 family)